MTTSTSPEPLAARNSDRLSPELEAFYERTAFQINREDGLVNIRMTWMLQFEGFLFAALALIASRENVREDVYVPLQWILPGLGISAAAIGWLGVDAALGALKNLKRQWLDRGIPPNVIPPPCGTTSQHLRAQTTIYGLPFLLIVAWGTISGFWVYKAYHPSPALNPARAEASPSAPQSINAASRTMPARPVGETPTRPANGPTLGATGGDAAP